MGYSLLLKQAGYEADFLWRDQPIPHFFDEGGIGMRHDFKRHERGAAKAACIGIDMAEQQVNVLLCIGVEGPAFRDHVADKLVVLFNSTFLAGLSGVAVKDPRTRQAVPCAEEAFQGTGVFKFRTIVGEDDREEAAEQGGAEQAFQRIEYGQGAARALGVHLKGRHKMGMAAVHGQEDGTPAGPFHGIHFRDRKAGIVSGKAQEILIGAPLPVTVITGRFLMPAFFVRDLPPQVQVGNGKEAL